MCPWEHNSTDLISVPQEKMWKTLNDPEYQVSLQSDKSYGKQFAPKTSGHRPTNCMPTPTSHLKTSFATV